MIKIKKIVVITCAIISLSSSCMDTVRSGQYLTKPKFDPIVQADPELDKWRSSYGYAYEPCERIDHVDDGYIRCFQYAFRETTGFTEYVAFPGSLTIEDFFEQTKNPQFNDLVIYTPDKNDREMNHFAIVIDTITFKSKWGLGSTIWRHGLFKLPKEYGDAAWFFTLKETYKTSEGKIHLLADIKSVIAAERK